MPDWWRLPGCIVVRLQHHDAEACGSIPDHRASAVRPGHSPVQRAQKVGVRLLASKLTCLLGWRLMCSRMRSRQRRRTSPKQQAARQCRSFLLQT